MSLGDDAQTHSVPSARVSLFSFIFTEQSEAVKFLVSGLQVWVAPSPPGFALLVVGVAGSATWPNPL